MKFIFCFASIVCFSQMGLSQEEQVEFEKQKTEIVNEIDQRIAKMNEHKICVSNAQNRDDMKVCRETMREFHKGEKIERMEKRKERKEQRMQKMKDNNK